MWYVTWRPQPARTSYQVEQKNEGPDFYVEVEKVPVPEIGELELAIPTSC